MACDPQTLTTAAACIECGIPPGMQLPVLISLFCQIATNGVGPGTGFTSVLLPMNAQFWTANHGLSATPSVWECVIVCVAPDAATLYVAGDETKAVAWTNADVGSQEFIPGVNATSIFASAPESLFTNPASGLVVPKGGGLPVTPTSFVNFRLKFYARI